jgi:hypothetical protein
MPITYIERSLGTLTMSASTVSTLQLPREHLYNRIFFRVVCATSTTNNYVAGAQRLAMDRIELIANGQLVIKSYSGADLCKLTEYVNAIAAVDETATTAAKTAGFGSAIMDLSLTRKDVSCLLPSFKFTSLDLKVSWPALATTGGDAGLITVNVASREVLYTDEWRNAPLGINKETTISQPFAATGFGEINLPIGNVYRRVAMFCEGGATGTGAQNDTVTDIEVIQDGVITHKKWTFLEVQAKDKAEYHLETKIGGMCMLGFDATGDGSALVDSAPFGSWKVRVNVPSVANAVTVRLIPQEIIYPRG